MQQIAQTVHKTGTLLGAPVFVCLSCHITAVMVCRNPTLQTQHCHHSVTQTPSACLSPPLRLPPCLSSSLRCCTPASHPPQKPTGRQISPSFPAPRAAPAVRHYPSYGDKKPASHRRPTPYIMCVFAAIVMLIPAMAVGSRRPAATRVSRDLRRPFLMTDVAISVLSRASSRKCRKKRAGHPPRAPSYSRTADGYSAARFCPFVRNSGQKRGRGETVSVIGVTVTAGVLPAACSPVMSAKYAASDGNGATRRGGPAAVGRGAPEDGGPGLVQTTAVF